MKLNRTSTSVCLLSLPVWMASSACSIGSAPSTEERDRATEDAAVLVATPHASAPAFDTTKIAPIAMPPRIATPPGLQPVAQALESDVCGAYATTLSADTYVAFSGSTSGADSAWTTYCADTADAPAPDTTIPIEITDACTLTLSLSADFAAAFELRTACDTGGDQLGCVNPVNADQLRVGVSPGLYYVVIDGVNQESGNFELTATCATPVCGDGIKNPGTEQCDGGASPIAGDGCGDPGAENQCQLEVSQAADTCADAQSIYLVPNSMTVFPQAGEPYNTTGAGSDYEEASGMFWPASDQVFDFVAGQTGVIQIRVGLDRSGNAFCAQDWFSPGCWNHLVYVRESSCDGNEIDYGYPTLIDDDGVTTLRFAAGEGEHYFVFVDGFDMTEYDAGPYFLEVSMMPPQ